MLEKYHFIDHQLFLALNGFHTESLDSFMLFITNKYTAIPLYLLFIAFLIKQYKQKTVSIIITIVASVGIADAITSRIMKPYFQQFRPCHDPSFAKFVNLVGDCGGQFGFASSHAANSFAIFGISFLFLKWQNNWTKLFLFWAILVAYSRVYIGVHYPFDVLVGMFIGLISSLFIYQLFKNKLQKL